jgi:hypothetical protein
MSTDAQVDDAVVAYLATANGHWRKVAMVFARVAEALGGAFPEGQAGHDFFNRRIETLVLTGRLDAKGNLKLWRNSEVRLS